MSRVAEQQRQQGSVRERARWTGLTSFGLALIGVAPFLLVASALIWGLDVGGELPFFVSLIVVPWVAALLVWRFGTWARIVAIVVALAGVGTMFWTAFGLAVPASFFDFVPGLLVLPGAGLAIGGAIASLVAKRRGHVGARPEGRERRAMTVIASVVGVLAVLSAVLTVASRETVDATDAAAVVTLKSFEYDRDGYAVPGGSQVVVRNEDPFFHTFTIDALGIDVELGPNSQALVEMPAEAGTYVVYCRPHTSDPESPSEDDMTSTVTIE